MSPLGVVHVYKACAPVRGGIEGHIDVLTRLLAQRGLRPEVLCARTAGTQKREVRDGVRVQRCASPLTLASAPIPPFLPAALWRNRADIVHLHYPWPPGELAWLLAGRTRPLVVTLHCEVVRYPSLGRLVAPLTRRVLRAAARIVVSGAFMRHTPMVDEHRDRVQHIPHGIDLDRFRPDPNAVDPLPAIAHPRIIFVGRLRHYKGLPVLAEALAQLSHAQLVVVGDGPERERFEETLRARGCRARAHLVGDVDDDQLIHLLQTADVAVLPSTSRAEAFGLAIAEAQACGVPAVTTDVGTGTAQTVADGLSGRIVRPGNPAELADALTWCLDPQQRAARRAAARAHAEAALCARRMAAAIHAVYDEVRDRAHLS